LEKYQIEPIATNGVDTQATHASTECKRVSLKQLHEVVFGSHLKRIKIFMDFLNAHPMESAIRLEVYTQRVIKDLVKKND